MMVTKTAGFQNCPLYLLLKARLNRVQLFSRTSFRHFRRTRLEGRVFLPARRWCLELGRASGGTAGAHPPIAQSLPKTNQLNASLKIGDGKGSWAMQTRRFSGLPLIGILSVISF